MRLLGFFVVLFLGFVLIIGSNVKCGVVARDVFWNGSKEAIDNKKKLEERARANKSNVDVVIKDDLVKKCKLKKLELCDYYLSHFENNTNVTLDDDKRRVPTGPNPLHNR
ncbi:hypothetical protein FRX31_024180 [Thalictrum thalictroides]|uniref:CLAVATA3/ESR (CLE)-related protein n=1 Tax=Thalictrum thalictroides TaxID=46969 RepID=A0A7J6VPW3_THATH|nr:hypothetical protein FRX31_024180 [Thalictrum thalictroides]